MAENTQTPQAVEPAEVETPNRFQRFVTNHPRTVKVVGAIVSVAAVGTVVTAVKNRQDRKQLDAAANDLGEALDLLEPVATTTD